MNSVKPRGTSRLATEWWGSSNVAPHTSRKLELLLAGSSKKNDWSTLNLTGRRFIQPPSKFSFKRPHLSKLFFLNFSFSYTFLIFYGFPWGGDVHQLFPCCLTGSKKNQTGPLWMSQTEDPYCIVTFQGILNTPPLLTLDLWAFSHVDMWTSGETL